MLSKSKLFTMVIAVLLIIAYSSVETHNEEGEMSKILKTVDHYANYWGKKYKLETVEDVLTGNKITIEKIIDTVICTIHHESRFKPRSKSWEKRTKCYSWGLMRLLPNTAKGEGWKGANPEELYDIDLNLKLGVKYLCKQIKRYKSIKKGVAAYNAGHTKYSSSKKRRYVNQHYVNQVYHKGYVQYRITYRDGEL